MKKKTNKTENQKNYFNKTKRINFAINNNRNPYSNIILKHDPPNPFILNKHHVSIFSHKTPFYHIILIQRLQLIRLI